jgi:tRNA nucleotidyltransferase (CCA-adding enzyme)
MSRSVSFRHAQIDRNPIPIPEQPDVHLTEVEAKLCTLLDDCTKYLADKGTYTSCRIAGGWVRDKVCVSLHEAARCQ